MRYDVAVVGLGAMGSMAAWRLAERGASVVGFDRFAPPHDHGSSHGESRITRTAYYEGPAYVPLLQASFPMWHALESASGAELLTMTGALMIGPPDSEVVAGALHSARAHGLRHELLDAEEAMRRFPGHRMTRDEIALLEPQAGFLRPERCISAALARARERGADLRLETPVVAVDADDGGVRIATETGVVEAGQCIVSAGAWTRELLPSLGVQLWVERQVLAWFDLDEPELFGPARFPVWFHELPDGRHVYGFPTLDGETLKLAFHHGGRSVAADDAEPAGPDDIAPLRDVVERHFRGVRASAARTVVCRYTNTPDEYFIVDRLLGSERVLLVSACSGHGFKFAAILGDVAADLALTGATAHDISTFALARFDDAGSAAGS